jgi:cytochrome c5
MTTSKQSKALFQKTLAAVIATVVIGGLTSTLYSDEPKSGALPSQTDSAPSTTQITGAELYSIHCNRCHPERYPTERTAAQWKTIMLHMQVRANLPVSQSKLILKYLQENSGR